MNFLFFHTVHCEPFAKSFEKSFEKSFADPATREMQVFRQIDEFFSKDFCQFDDFYLQNCNNLTKLLFEPRSEQGVV